MLCVAVRQGLGKRDDDLSTSAHEAMNRVWSYQMILGWQRTDNSLPQSLYISNIFFMPALACSQMAVGALTLRLSRSDSTTLTLLKRLVQANYVTLGIIGLWTIAGIITFAVPIGSKPASATNTQVGATQATRRHVTDRCPGRSLDCYRGSQLCSRDSPCWYTLQSCWLALYAGSKESNCAFGIRCSTTVSLELAAGTHCCHALENMHMADY